MYNAETTHAQPLRERGTPYRRPDITESGLLQGASDQQEGHICYQSLIEHATDAIMIVCQGRVVYRNRTHEKWFGFLANDTSRPCLLAHATLADREHVHAYEQALCQGEGVPERCELTLLSQEGRRLHLEVISQSTAYQASPALAVVMRDVTARCEAEAVLRAHAAQDRDPMRRDIQTRQQAEKTINALQRDNGSLRDTINTTHHFEEIVGTSAALTRVLQQVEQVASTDATVLITGETGTGKELIVRALHHHSPRRDRPLIKVNCTALSAGLIESELFGHEKGAFTGAIARKLGRFELAAGGTLFLDEMGEMPLEVQAKLLRVLQEGEFERVGGMQTLTSDVRVIAATNRDLQHAVAAHDFRADLFYRLHVFPIHLPPLRERPEDIPVLVQHFVTTCGQRLEKRIETIEPATMERLRAYAWPGNIRELEHLIERTLILTRGSTLVIDDTLLSGTPIPPVDTLVPALHETWQTSCTLADVERDYIVHTLEKTGWVVEGPNGAACILDLHPNTLRGRMRRLGIVRLHDSG